MQGSENENKYNLGERTTKFAENIRDFVKKVEIVLSNIEDSKQLIRASGSVGANFIEAEEALSKKDFIYRIKICRKEAKESRYWLRLIYIKSSDISLNEQRSKLIDEAFQLMKIFGAIITKSGI